MARIESLKNNKLVETIAGKEKLTPEALVRNYASAVLGVCLANTNNFHDSEDIMQEVFLKAFTKINGLRDQSSVRPWLMKIARRKCIDHYRKSSRSRIVPEDMPVLDKCSDEQILRLHKAIAELPDGYREPITLYYLDGRKCSSVAKSLGISDAAVRRRLVRARLRLHEILSEDRS